MLTLWILFCRMNARMDTLFPVWHKDKWHSPAFEAFLSLTREMLATQRVINVTESMATDASNEPGV